MNDARTHSETARARRRDAGLVAQYIHELSERHASSASQDGEPRPRPEDDRDLEEALR
jgi:hypothetical protein